MKSRLLLLPLLFLNSCIVREPVRNVAMADASGAPLPTLVGRASSTTWFWTWTTGDSSVEKARENGGITNVTSMTRTTNSFLGVIVHDSLTVRGD